MNRFLSAALTAVLLLFLACTVSSPAVSEVLPLDTDLLTFGRKPIAANFTDNSYEDESISVQVRRSEVIALWTTILTVKIADPSQIRTAMSNDSYDDRTYVKASSMADHVNAVAAVDGDFFKYDYDTGYVLRQGTLYRDRADGTRDVLLIDDHGDFHCVRQATGESIAAFTAHDLPEGRSIMNSFTFGPLLIENGKVQELHTTEFQYNVKMQRVAIVQLGELEYAIVECDGSADSSSGMTMARFAEYIHDLFPDCLMAYNLDGGGSTNVIFNGKRMHKNTDSRKICDILYFASAHGE